MAGDFKTDFPIFKHTPHVYLDSAATTHKPQMVIDAIGHFYTHQYGTVRRGLYQLASQATNLYEQTRILLAQFIGASNPSEIIFTSGATEGINLVAYSYLRPLLKKGDEIIISILEHHANFIPWQQLAIEKEAILRILPTNERGELTLDTLKEALNERTRMVALSLTSNVTGGVTNVRDFISATHQAGVKILIDGAQSTGHMPVNMLDLDCDFFVFSGHKIYGPTGTGILYGKEILLNQMPPYHLGGEMIIEVTPENSVFQKAPQRFEAGTPNIAGIIGLGAAVQYINAIGWERLMLHEQQLTTYLLKSLQDLNVRLIGHPMARSSLVSFLIDDIHPHDAATILDSMGIAVRAGHHCAQPFMRYLGLPATVRASLAWYNDENDIDQLTEGIKIVRKIMQ